MDPALLPQLGHDGINPWETSLSLSPFGQCLWVLIPGNAHTDGVALHLVKSRVGGSSSIKKFSPQQLAIEGKGRGAGLLYLKEKKVIDKFES